MNAVVFLDGQGRARDECRCIKVGRKTSVLQMIEKMVRVQRDWESIGKSSSKFDEGSASTTDAPEESYGLVLVTDSGDGRPPTEEVLSRDLQVDSDRFVEIRQSWAQIILRQMSARCARANAVAGSKYAPPPDEDYWFRLNTKGAGARETRVKLVDLDNYTVAKKKAGWLTVKDKGGKKPRWVVLHENTLRWFTDADETAKPVGILDNVNAVKMVPKASKKGDTFTIELKSGKIKMTLYCENDVMWERWQDALQRGRSGRTEQDKSRAGFQLKLDVELIPEFTEEEELAFETRGRVPHVSSLITTDQLASGDTYLSIEGIAAHAQDGGYLSIGDIATALINPSDGVYLDLDGLAAMATKAGYTEAEADMYIAVGQLPWDGSSADGGYLDLNTMQALLKGSGDAYLTLEEARSAVSGGDGGYLDLTSMQRLAKGSGGDDTYFTVDQAQSVAGKGRPTSQPDDIYLTIADACWWMAQNGGKNPKAAPPAAKVLTAAQVATAPARGKVWVSANGTVLSGADSVKLCHENGYLTVAEMSDLAKS